MRIVWLTDLHLNFLKHNEKKKKAFFRGVCKARPDTVIISGDISTGEHFNLDLAEFYEAINKTDVYFVLGNHDFYHGKGFADTRHLAKSLGEMIHVHYLRDCGPVMLNDKWALCGVDGWGDAQEGNWMGTRVEMNDWIYIPNLAGKSRVAINAILQRMGEQEAELLHDQLHAAEMRGAAKIIVVTHVPPFLEAASHRGNVTDANYAPFYVCKAVGAELLKFARHTHIDQIAVYCGHTHGAAKFQALDNLCVYAADAEYGLPNISGIIDI